MVEPSTLVPDHDHGEGSAHGRKKIIPNIRPAAAVAIIAAVVSLVAFLYFFANGMTNVYGDGIAHINIARKVVDSPDDSLWQRYMQIGSPWLPLQTIAIMPLAANDWMWRTGIAGSVVSMLSFVIAAVSLYLLAHSLYRKEDSTWQRALPLLSAAIFILNPSALYMQSTPMSELVFMAALVAAAYLLQRWLNDQTSKRLVVAALAMALATLARYEAWPVAALSLLIVAWTAHGNLNDKIKQSLLFAGVVASGPLYWLWHNWAIYGNALEFLSGPNSARGIASQNRVNFAWSAIFVGHPVLDLVTMAAAVAVCTGPFVLLLGGAGFARSLVAKRNALREISPVFLLILPFFFHTFSMYRGEIQVFPLSAFGLLNIRYGLPHLMAVALFAPAAILIFRNSTTCRWAGIAVCLVVGLQYAYLISEGPSQLAIYQEGYRNGVNARPVRERARVSSFLRANPPSGVVLMHTGALGPVVTDGGLSFSNTIHEGTIRWHQLDPGIPGDVEALIVQENDPLAVRINNTSALARDLAAGFEVKFSSGNIRVYERRSVAPSGVP